MSGDPDDVNADTVRDLLRRIGIYLDDTAAHPGQTYHEGHPANLLARAENVIDELAIRSGLWPAPRTVQLGKPT